MLLRLAWSVVTLPCHVAQLLFCVIVYALAAYGLVVAVTAVPGASVGYLLSRGEELYRQLLLAVAAVRQEDDGHHDTLAWLWTWWH